MDLKPIIAVSVGIAIYRGIVCPLLDRYRGWRGGHGEPLKRVVAFGS